MLIALPFWCQSSVTPQTRRFDERSTNGAEHSQTVPQTNRRTRHVTQQQSRCRWWEDERTSGERTHASYLELEERLGPGPARAGPRRGGVWPLTTCHAWWRSLSWHHWVSIWEKGLKERRTEINDWLCFSPWIEKNGGKKTHMNIQFNVQITVKVRVQEKTIIVTTMHKTSHVWWHVENIS